MNPVLAVMAALALGQDADPARQEPAARLGDIVVEGERNADRARAFVDEVIAPPPRRGPARWDRRVCVGAANLQSPIARYLIDRISSVAIEVGLRPGEPGCRAQVLVIGASDGAEMARAVVAARPSAFRPGGNGMDRGRGALEAFQAGDAPVRWWHVSLPVTETGDPAVVLPGSGPTTTRGEASRIRTLIRNDLLAAILIVDVERADSASLEQLADYLAMVALAQIDPEADTERYDTVLNLFLDPAGTGGLTDWDRRYLRALYAADLGLANPNAQVREVAAELAEGGTAADQATRQGDGGRSESEDREVRPGPGPD